MKKMFFLGMAVLILSLAFVGCGGDDDDSKNTTGGLTITGLSAFGGQYAYATNGTLNLIGVSSKGKTALISSDGSVVLTVYKSASVYKGNDAEVVFSVAIYDKEVTVGPSMGSPVTSGSISVTFKNGKASGTFTAY